MVYKQCDDGRRGNSWSRTVLLAVCAVACVRLAGCDVDTPHTGGGTEPARTTSVYITATEGLNPPAIGRSNTYEPDALLDIDPADASAGRYAGFHLTVAVDDPPNLKIRLVNGKTGARADFHKLESNPASGEHGNGTGIEQLTPTTMELLRANTPVFHTMAASGVSDSLTYRLALFVPESLISPFARIDVFTRTAGDEAPIGADSIELTPGFFYLAVIGDSVQWGNGLEDRDKFSTLVAGVIEEELGVRVIRQVHAHSSARIVPADGDSACEHHCWGEVPTASTSISLQTELIDRPDLVDLILMDGCINDVGLGVLLDPNTNLEDLSSLTQYFCETEMTVLLGKVRAIAPQARVVVTAYFQIVGVNSNLFGLEQFATVQGTSLDQEMLDLREGMVANSIVFDQESRAGLAAAVNTINALQPGPPMVSFVPVSFSPDNAIFAPDNWLWGLTSDEDLLKALELDMRLFPEDPLVMDRLETCGSDDVVLDLLTCLYGSAGHPNPAGARAYADAIIAALQTSGMLPEDAAGK